MNKRLLKEFFYRVAPKRSLPHDRASILMYHTISDRTDYFSSVSPAAFAAQMAVLAARNAPVVSLEELVRRLREGEELQGVVAITFDDGYQDNLTAAYPILETYGFPATIFVTTGLIGTTDARGQQMLSTEELVALESSGLVSIQPHTASHPRLSTLSSTEARSEIEGSKQTLETLLGTPRTLFAYPKGDYTRETMAITQALGFAAAVTVREGTVGGEHDLFALPRVSIDRTTTKAQFIGKISRAVDWYEKLKI